jgi:hypothetical protein
MTFERFLAIANLLIVASGAVWAGVDWYPTLKNSQATLEQINLNLNADKQLPFAYDGTLTVNLIKKLPDGTALYDLDFDMTNKNLSKSVISMSYSITHLYLGTANTDGLQKDGDVMAIDDPPDPWNGPYEGGVKWNEIECQGSILDGDTNQAVIRWLQSQCPKLDHGGFTAILPTGVDTEYDPTFVVRARPDQYVAMVVGFGVNNTLDATSPNIGLVYDFDILANADIQSSATIATTKGPSSTRLSGAIKHKVKKPIAVPSEVGVTAPN